MVFTALGDVASTLRTAVASGSSSSSTSCKRPHSPEGKPGRATRPRVQAGDRVILVPLDLSTLEPDASGYAAVQAGAGGEERVNFQKLIQDGYQLIEWDGECVAQLYPTSVILLTSAQGDCSPCRTHYAQDRHRARWPVHLPHPPG